MIIGYVILTKRVNLAEDGFDYVPVSEVFTDPLDADYVLGGIARVELVDLIIGEINVSDVEA